NQPQPLQRLRGRRPDRRPALGQDRRRLRGRRHDRGARRRRDHRRWWQWGRAGGAAMSAAEGATPAAAGSEARSLRAETLRRFVQGDLASLRVVLGLAVIWIIFQLQNDRFLSAENLTNLMLQITAVGLISIGIVFVLLLGEIDLSVGAV